MTVEGRVLAGRYAVGQLLGRGGMAEVYRGVDRVLDRPVAVKILGTWLAHDDTFVERFRREALSAARISHPNLVAVYDAGSEEGIPYIVMELVGGETLADALRRDGRLDPGRAVDVTRRIASALAVAHAAGIVHRDVKPGNVMLTPDGGAKLMDLGIARTLDGESITRASTVLGTAGYLSPEQARGEPVDARSDIYSLGCVLFEMLAGRPPFEADHPMAVAYRHVHEEPPSLSSVEPSAPPSLDAVTMRAMAKSPQDRFQTAEEMAAALADETLPLRPVAPTAPLPPVEPTRPPARRAHRPGGRRSPLPLLIALALLAAVVGLAAALLSGPGPRSGTAGSASSAASHSPAPSRSPSASPTSPPTTEPVEAAVQDLFTLVDQGLDDGAISEKAGKEIRDRANDALGKFQKGDTEKAIDELEELRHKVEEAVDHGEIAHRLKEKLDKAIVAIEEQMLRTASSEDG